MKQIWRYNRTYRQTRGRIVCRFLFVLFLTSYFIVWISNTIKWTNVQHGVCAYLFIRFVIYYHDADSHSALSIVFVLHSDLLLLNACIWHWSDATAEIKIDDKCTFFAILCCYCCLYSLICDFIQSILTIVRITFFCITKSTALAISGIQHLFNLWAHDLIVGIFPLPTKCRCFQASIKLIGIFSMICWLKMMLIPNQNGKQTNPTSFTLLQIFEFAV